METPIPDDWDGLTFCNYTILWPDSIRWRIIVKGLLSDPSLAEFWDKTTGDVAQVLQDFQPTLDFNLDNLECGDMNIPIGTILMTAAQVEPDGWKICNGSALFRADFPELFALIGTTYGPGDGSITFNLPDLRSRVPVGHAPGDADFDTVGETGGEKTHTLTSAEMPVHTHVQNQHTHIQNPHNHLTTQPIYTQLAAVKLQFDATGTNIGTETLPAATPTNENTTPTNQNAGGGAAHNNLQPYIILNYIIRTGLPVV